MAHVRSDDPRKDKIKAAFRNLVPGTTKVTLIEEKGGRFHASCLRPNGNRTFTNLGTHSFPVEELAKLSGIPEHNPVAKGEAIAHLKELHEALGRLGTLLESADTPEAVEVVRTALEGLAPRTQRLVDALYKARGY